MQRVLVLLVLLAACDSPAAPREFVGHLGATDVWSGAEVVVVSPSFQTALPHVRIGSDTLSVRRLDDSTVVAQLPDGNGTRTLTIETAGFEPFSADVTLYGLRSIETGPLLAGYLELIPNTTRVLGAGDGLVEVDVRTGNVVRHWDETVHSADCISSVGPSVRVGYYVLWGKDSVGGRCTHPWVWHYGLTTLDRVDSLPAVPGAWGMAEIGPRGIIAGGDDVLRISHCDSAGCTPQTYFNQGGGLGGVSIARSANRAFLHHWFGFIVDATTGDTLGRLPLGPGGSPATQPFYHAENVAFSAGEDTAYVVGNIGASGSILLRILTSTGALIDTLPLTNTYATDVRVDDTRIYVALLKGSVGVNATRPELRIYDRANLQLIATLRAADADTLSPTEWHQFRLVPDLVMHAMYLVATVQVVGFDANAKILRYDLLP
ncbi:MAG TPA: hypothetical protein VKD28_00485 [Gemmatimonadales bacterium]|nr:hypothetical protein [Gemmatimonadales bacterium]